MPDRVKKAPVDFSDELPEIPLTDGQWRAIVKTLRLSSQQARIVKLVLRSAGNRQIADILGLREPTVRTYLERIFLRTGARDRMELAMRVLAAFQEVTDERCPRKG